MWPLSNQKVRLRILLGWFTDHTRLKCNREQPCEECTKRGEKVSCLYVTSTDKNLAMSVESGSETRHTEHELRRLERLVGEAIKLHHDNARHPVRSF